MVGFLTVSLKPKLPMATDPVTLYDNCCCCWCTLDINTRSDSWLLLCSLQFPWCSVSNKRQGPTNLYVKLLFIDKHWPWDFCFHRLLWISLVCVRRNLGIQFSKYFRYKSYPFDGMRNTYFISNQSHDGIGGEIGGDVGLTMYHGILRRWEWCLFE